MTISETLATTSYIRLPFDKLLAAKISGVAMKLCLFVGRFTSEKALTAFVPVQICANKFGCSARQVERMLKVLAKLGLIELTGHNELGKPTVKVLWWGQDPEATEQKKFDEPRPKSRPVPTKTSGDDRPKGRTKEQEDKQDNFKQQQPIELCDLGKELHATSIAKSVVAFLIEKYGSEICQKQLEHLRYLKEQGAKIRNQAAWLINAIKNDYQLPELFKSQEQLKTECEKAQKEQELKKLESKAQRLFDAGKYQEVVAILNSFPQNKVLHKAKSVLTQQQKLAQAEARLNSEQKENLMAQAWVKVQKCLKSNAKPVERLKSTKLYRDAAQGFFENAVLQM